MMQETHYCYLNKNHLVKKSKCVHLVYKLKNCSKWPWSMTILTAYDDVHQFFSPSDVDGKVIHLVERAPPQASISSSGGAGASAAGVEGGSSSGHVSTSSQGAPHDRNGNSYVMLGTFNLPVNIMDPQQIQVGMLHSVFVNGIKTLMLCDSCNLFCRCLFSR